MKKNILILSAFIVTLFVSGCSLTATTSYKCSKTSVSNGITTKIMYDIEHNNDTVESVKITYDYDLDDDNNNNNNNNVDNTILGNMIEEDIDGLNADTDGNSDSDNDEVIDGIVGDTFDAIVNGVTDTILDLSGLKNRHVMVSDRFSDVEGLTIDVEEDTNDHYKVVYDIDMAKISDDDLDIFNLDRSFKTLKDNYSDMTCS